MVFEMALQHCSSQGCEEMPTFAGPRSSEEVVWACGQHDAKLEREEGVKMYALVPICPGGRRLPPMRPGRVPSPAAAESNAVSPPARSWQPRFAKVPGSDFRNQARRQPFYLAWARLEQLAAASSISGRTERSRAPCRLRRTAEGTLSVT